MVGKILASQGFNQFFRNTRFYQHIQSQVLCPLRSNQDLQLSQARALRAIDNSGSFLVPSSTVFCAPFARECFFSVFALDDSPKRSHAKPSKTIPACRARSVPKDPLQSALPALYRHIQAVFRLLRQTEGSSTTREHVLDPQKLPLFAR